MITLAHTMSPTYSAIFIVVVRTCGRHNFTSALNPPSSFSMIPRTVHFGKYHILTSPPKIRPISDTAWRKKDVFDQLVLTVYGLLKLHISLGRPFLVGMQLFACERSLRIRRENTNGLYLVTVRFGLLFYYCSQK